MVDYQSKSGTINSKEIDLSKIYSTAANAVNGLNNVKISENNASWNSENLTYEIKDNNVVMILNNGVPIGYTNLQDLKPEDIEPKNSGVIASGEEAPDDVSATYEEKSDNGDLKSQGFSHAADGTGAAQISNLGNVTHKVSMDEYMEDNVEEVTTGTITREDTIDTTYNEEPASEVEESSSTVPAEETPNVTIEVEVQDEAAEEVKEEAEEHNAPIASGEEPNVTIEAEVQDEAAEEVKEEHNEPIHSGEELQESLDAEYEPTEEEMYNQEAKDFSVDRDLDEINMAVEYFGGNNGHSIYDDAKRSGNEEAYMENMNNMLDSLEGVEAQFNADGYGYSFQSTVFSGGEHATGSSSPTHFMGAKADLRWYKNGVQLDVGNATQEDWQYIKSVLQDNGLDVQFEKGNTVWGDTFLQQALNQNGEIVSYEGSNWGKGTDIHYTK